MYYRNLAWLHRRLTLAFLYWSNTVVRAERGLTSSKYHLQRALLRNRDRKTLQIYASGMFSQWQSLFAHWLTESFTMSEAALRNTGDAREPPTTSGFRRSRLLHGLRSGSRTRIRLVVDRSTTSDEISLQICTLGV